ncbi:MAG: hypothetical protein RJB13_2282, partial [Pseudomonadota bacterium]
MRIHLDLSTQSPTSYQPTKALKVAIHKCLFLLALIAALLSVQESNHRKTLLEGLSNAPTFQYLRMKCDNLEFPAAINHLKDNFLTNKRVNDDHLRTIYRDSGLSHLLALSGGQTVPAAYVISLLFTHCAVMFLRIFTPFIKGRHLIALFFVASIFEIFTLGFLVCLFQATGALSRALSNKWTELLRFCSKFCTCNVSASERWIWKTQLELAPWIIVWLIHKNPVHDLSFLLSLMGARTAG